MGALDLKALALNVEFRDRTGVMLKATAHEIVGEDSATANTEIRQKYGVQILNNVDNFVHRFSKSLAGIAAIAQTITIDGDGTTLVYSGAQSPTTEFDAIDIEIKMAITSIYDDLAGVINLL